MDGDGGGEKGEREIIRGLLETIESVRAFADYRRTQKKECFNLVRRLMLAAPLLEEMLDLDWPASEAVRASLLELARVFSLAKKLLRCCHDGSKIYLALEGEAVMARFHSVYEKLSQALDGMPYDELAISDEVKEQVELMVLQFKRSKRRTDTQDIELAMDLMVILSKKDDRNADSAILERLAKKLQLQTLPDLRAETVAVKKLVKERCWLSPESTQQIVDLLNQFKQIAGLEDINGLNDVKFPRYLEKCPSLLIPNDFLCSISLEIMTDPVIVASGQTYEKSSIQKWLDAGHRTCPKTRQTLAHLSLAPNYALRNLILSWCEKHNVELPKKDSCPSSDHGDNQDDIPSLINDLSSGSLEVQRNAVKKIRMHSKANPDSRILIASNGGILPLVGLLSYPDPKIQENAVTALLNLSIDDGNKQIIAKEGAIPEIIEILQNGTTEARENSAAALFSLSMLDENKVMIGSMNGIPPLVDLLQNGTIRGKKDAATALFNLCLNPVNKARAIDAGVVKPLLEVLADKNLGMVDEALSILLVLASHPDGRSEIGQLPFIQTLVEFIKDGTPKNKECALSVLLELGAHNSSFLLAALEYGVYEHLAEVTRNGTSRAQRKANSLLQLMRKSEQIP